MKKEKEKNNTQNWVNTLIAIFIFELIGLIIAIFLIINGTLELRYKSISTKNIKEQPPIEEVDTNNNVSNTKYTYDTIKGLYNYNQTFKLDGENVTEKFDLLLNEDGTYYYVNSLRVGIRSIGNYIIKDNTIILNKLLNVTDGPGLAPSFETIKLTIISNSEITFNTKTNYNSGNNQDITLTKTNEEEKEKFINTYKTDIKNLLENSYFTNKKSNEQN